MGVKSKLQQAGDGTAIPSGFVGEVINFPTVTINVTSSQAAANVGSPFALPAGTFLFVGKGAFSAAGSATVAGGGNCTLTGTGVTVTCVAQNLTTVSTAAGNAIDLPLTAVVISTGTNVQAKTTITYAGTGSVDIYINGKFIRIA